MVDNNKNIDFKTQDEHGYTPLMHAIEEEDFNAVKLLLKNNPDLQVKNKDGNTALMLATLSYDLAMIKLLIKNGAEINTYYKYNETLLMYASSHGYLELVTILLKNGADVHMRSNFNSTALMRASNVPDNVNIVRLLLKHGAHINEQDTYGLTALFYAVLIKDLEIVHLLVKHGANIHAQSKHHETALSLALALGNREIAEFLIENGAVVHKQDQENAIEPSRTLNNKVVAVMGKFEDFIEELITDIDTTILTLSQDQIDTIIQDIHYEPEILQELLSEVEKKRNKYFHRQNYFDYTALKPLAFWILLVIIAACLFHYITTYYYLPLTKKLTYLIEQQQILSTALAQGKVKLTLTDIADIQKIANQICIVDSSLNNGFIAWARTIIRIIIALLLKPILDNVLRLIHPQYKKRYEKYCLIDQKLREAIIAQEKLKESV